MEVIQDSITRDLNDMIQNIEDQETRNFVEDFLNVTKVPHPPLTP